MANRHFRQTIAPLESQFMLLRIYSRYLYFCRVAALFASHPYSSQAIALCVRKTTELQKEIFMKNKSQDFQHLLDNPKRNTVKVSFHLCLFIHVKYKVDEEAP